MSEKQMENNIDEIFRKGIDQLNTEPSDEFWRKAAENVISRGNKPNERKVALWRNIAFIQAAGLLLIGYFAYQTQTGKKNAVQQALTVKNIQNKNVEKINPPVKVSNNNSAATPTVASVNNNTGKTQKLNSSGRNAIHRAAVQQKHFTKLNAAVVALNNNSAYSKKPEKNIVATTYKTEVKNVITKESNQLAGNKEAANNVTTTADIIAAPAENQAKNNTENTSPAPVEYVQKTNRPAAITMGDTAKLIQSPTPELAQASSRFSVSAFFAPDFALGYTYKTSGTWGSRNENSIKTGEKQSFSYTAGLKTEYKISSRFSIAAGIGYQVFSFHVNPTVIYAEKQSGSDAGYYLATSSGEVVCPYYGPVNAGDSLKMNASSKRTYLEIPIQLKYFAINNTKCRFYIVGGLEANFLLGESTTMNWQDFWNESGVANVNTTGGAKNIYFSSYAGIGADYNLSKFLSIYAEPGLHEAITSLDDNVSVITYPRLFSITTGITWHF
jgi:hypothetical protein